MSEIFYLQGKKQQLLIEACLFVVAFNKYLSLSLCLWRKRGDKHLATTMT
jgi:hypothetical protein